MDIHTPEQMEAILEEEMLGCEVVDRQPLSPESVCSSNSETDIAEDEMDSANSDQECESEEQHRESGSDSESHHSAQSSVPEERLYEEKTIPAV